MRDFLNVWAGLLEDDMIVLKTARMQPTLPQWSWRWGETGTEGMTMG